MATEKRKIDIVIGAKNVAAKGITKAIQMVRKLGNITKTVFKAGVIAVAGLTAALGAMVKSAANAGDAFQKMSLRTGVSVKALSELKHAAEISGASIEDIEKSFRTLQKRMSDASFGLETYQRIFRKLNVDYRDAQGNLRNVDAVFMDAVGAINALSSETEKAAMAQELFGRSGTMLLPLIREGKTGIAALRTEAELLGITFTDVQANQAAKFNDELARLTSAFKGIKNTIGLELMPVVTRSFTNLKDKIIEIRREGKIKAWITGFREGVEEFLPVAQKLLTWASKLAVAAGRITKAVMETLGADFRSELQKINDEIAFMDNKFESMTFFETAVEWEAERNRLIAIRQRLLDEERERLARNAAERKKGAGVVGGGGEDAGPGFSVNREQAVFDAHLKAYDEFLKQKEVLRESALQSRLTAGGQLAGLTDPTAAAPEDVFSQAWLGYQSQLDALNQFNVQKLQLMQTAGFSEAAIMDENARMVMESEKKKRDFQLTAAAQTFGGMSNIMQNLMVATGSRNKTMFKAMQGFAIAESLINTYQGATKAYATVPYPFNFVAAASVIAAGMAQVAQIRAQTPQGGGGSAISAGGTAAPTYGGGSPSAYPVPTRIERDVKPTQTVNITIHTLTGAIDGRAQEEIVRAINEAGDRNVKINSNVIAAG